MKKIKLLLSVAMLALTIGLGLTCTFRTARADEMGRECNCTKISTGQSGLLCMKDGSEFCCVGGCYDIAALMESQN